MPQNIRTDLAEAHQQIDKTVGHRGKSRSTTQIVLNIILYIVLVYFFLESVIDRDYWYAFVVGFLIAVSIILTLLPKYHAKEVSPGDYPYED